MTPAPAATLEPVLRAYARRFHDAVGDEHHVASPLGAWLVLALAGAAAGGNRLADPLGCPADEAFAIARELLARPHRAVSAGAAAWRNRAVDTPELSAWLQLLEPVARTGDLPSQAEADAWAQAQTLGLIERFPLSIDEDTLVVLASALACSITWQRPFDVVRTAELTRPPTAGFDGLDWVLLDPRPLAQGIVDSRLGRLAVHAAGSADDDLVVVSVVAPPESAASDVLDEAQRLAAGVATELALDAESLFELPLGAGHAWTISEQRVQARTARSRSEQYRCLLPAWSATSRHRLLTLPGLGFDVAGAVLAGLLGPQPGGLRIEAVQAAMARYTRTGFEAAAVTGVMASRAALVGEREVVVRTAQLEFCRPHAVVAVARADDSPWHGLPVFSAWVTSADEPA